MSYMRLQQTLIMEKFLTHSPVSLTWHKDINGSRLWSRFLDGQVNSERSIPHFPSFKINQVKFRFVATVCCLNVIIIEVAERHFAGHWSSIPHAHVSGHRAHIKWVHINVTQSPRPESEGRKQRSLPRWAPVAGWWCVASPVSVGSCPGPRASLSLALSACTAAVYRCISSASPAGSNREHSADGRGRLEGRLTQRARSYS